MITERTLKKWRKEALNEADMKFTTENAELTLYAYRELQKRILRMTQELMDLHLMKGK